MVSADLVNVAVKVDATTTQKFDRLLRVQVFDQVEGKIELPRRYARRRVATRVAEGQTNLDDFEQINVALHGLIVIPTLLRKITVHDLGARRPKDRTKSAHKHFVDDRNRSLIMS